MGKYKIDSTDANYVKIIAVEDILSGEKIGVWLTDYYTDNCRYLFQEGMSKKWYETFDLGRYCNHSNNPNSVIHLVETEKPKFNNISNILENINYVEINLTSKGILKEEEITVDYRLVEYLTGYKVNTNFN